jgi:competence protein ComEC
LFAGKKDLADNAGMNSPVHHGFAFPGNIWQAPLLPVALAWTVGIVLDRFATFTWQVVLGWFLITLFLWLGSRGNRNLVGPLVFLGSIVVAAGAVQHQLAANRIAPDDVSLLLEEEAKPARVRGEVFSEPVLVRGSNDPLRSLPTKDSTRFVLAPSECKLGIDWVKVRGLIHVTAPKRAESLHVGDVVEVAGHLALPAGPGNPSDLDFAGMLRDQGMRAILSAPQGSSGVIVLEKGWPRSFFGWLGKVRAWGIDVLHKTLPPEQVGVAGALLLGDNSGMNSEDWEKYLRTGTLHVLAISGQHLLVLAIFLEWVFRIGQMRRRTRVLAITLLLFGYAFLTGGRPPVMRAAWAMAALCGSVLFQRPVLPGNTFALAWLGVALVHPTDIFNPGCQMSFLAVFVLIWGVGSWTPSEPDPLEKVLAEARPFWLTVLRGWVGWLAWLFFVNLVVWAAMVPLVAMKYHLISPAAALVGLPVVICSSAALVTGFLTLVFAAFFWPLAVLFGWFTQGSLHLCEWLVDMGTQVPGGYFYVPDLPSWWVGIFYLGLVLALTLPWFRSRPLLSGLAGLGWFLLACWIWWGPRFSDEFRCTFLAVGHGGCTVVETPGGQVLVYDVGALTGPEVTRRQVAPFLWQRGRDRVDEVLISHADLDHFNGLPALLDRFEVGQITTTPSFADRSSPAVRRTLEAMEKKGTKVRQVKVGETWEVGGVSLEVLHPPLQGPEGPENARSLVLQVIQGKHVLLLTGDLQTPGLEQVLALPQRRVDVLMAPHHGSKTSNTSALAEWAQPRVVVSCQRQPLGGIQDAGPYERRGIPYLGTWPHGAVTIRGQKGKWWVETFKTKLILDLP